MACRLGGNDSAIYVEAQPSPLHFDPPVFFKAIPPPPEGEPDAWYDGTKWHVPLKELHLVPLEWTAFSHG